MFSSLFPSTFEIKNENIYNKFQIQYLKDETSKLTIEDMKKKEFFQTTKNYFNLGYVKGTVWFKFNIKNSSEIEKFILTLNETFYEIANLYYENNGKMQKLSNSLFTLINQREVKSNQIAFNIDLPKDEEKTIYLELQGKYAYFGKVEIYDKENFYFTQSMGINTIFAFSLGIIFILSFFTLFLYSKSKEKIYLYYLGYSFFLFIYFLNINGLFVFLNLQEHIYDFQLSAAFMIGFLILFSKEYLETKKYLKLLDKVLNILAIPFFIFGICVLYSYQPWNKFINNSTGFICILLITISIIIYFKGHHQARYYILVMTSYLGCIVAFTFMVNGALEYSFLTRYGYVFSVIVEMITFSYLLANRYYLMKQETQICLEEEVKNRTDELNILLQEKELLLKEIYHRVRNNFHMIIAMLYLEKEKEKIDFLGLINRVKSISLIHEYLYRNKDISKIKIDDYLEKLIDNLKITYPKIKIKFKSENIPLNFDNALSLGIIINEILTNSIKHNNKTNLILELEVKKESKKNIYVCMKDNGKGFENIESKGLGLKLVNQFCKKLINEESKFSFENGAKFELRFNVED